MKLKLLSPPRQSDPHAEETAEGSAGTVAASAADPMAIKDKRKTLKMKRRRCALNADGPSIPSTGSPSSADPAPSNSAEPPCRLLAAERRSSETMMNGLSSLG
jgi:hypothetical protein